MSKNNNGLGMNNAFIDHSETVIQKENTTIINERIDDIALLIASMKKMGLHQIIDNCIPKQRRQRKISWGWTTIIWLAYILSEGDHRKISMTKYIERMQNTLSELSGQIIEPLDFDDDRLANLLSYLSKQDVWYQIERELSLQSIRVYDLCVDTVRCDATTVSGYHENESASLFNFGHSKDNPDLRQIKIMVGSLDPMGMPLVTDVVSGERADDNLYIPAIQRIDNMIDKSGLLYVGDCKMSSFDNRLHINAQSNYYLSPLPLVGNTALDMEKWISDGILKDENDNLENIFREDAKSKTSLIAKGYEFRRELSGFEEEKQYEWTERVIVVQSPSHALQQEIGLERRMDNAMAKIKALTPTPGKGKRQIKEEEDLVSSISKILKGQRVEGLLHIDYEKQIEKQIKYVGRGRGSENRQKKEIEKVRYQITQVLKDEKKIAAEKKRFGWKAFVTNASQEHLSMEKSVLCYRNEYRVERIFNRLKSRLNISPLFVRKDDQISGMTYLLSLGVRVLTLIEFILRRSLKNDGVKLSDLHPENRKKETDIPTVERVLKKFSGITLNIIKVDNRVIMRYITPLSDLQIDILHRIGIDCNVYQNLTKT